MRRSPYQVVTAPIAAQLVTPPVTEPSDVEVDMEVLRTVKNGFEVHDEATANWVVRHVQDARRYAAKVKEWAERETKRAEREEATLLFLFGRQLERWTANEIEKLSGRRRSLSLPSGCVGYRHQPPRLVVDDDDLVVIWAKQNCPQAVQTVVVEKLVKAELKAHFESTGEVPDEGVHVDPGGNKFYIRDGSVKKDYANTTSEE